MFNGSGSRLGVRGVEDLGGGLQALFNIEHRFNADTGALRCSDPARFWHGRSIVGLQGGFGQFVLGREYTTSFRQSQLVADPWGWDTVVAATRRQRRQHLDHGRRRRLAVPAASTSLPLDVANVRNDSSFTYSLNLGGFRSAHRSLKEPTTIIQVARTSPGTWR